MPRSISPFRLQALPGQPGRCTESPLASSIFVLHRAAAASSRTIGNMAISAGPTCAVRRFCRHFPCFRSWRKRKSLVRRREKARLFVPLCLKKMHSAVTCGTGSFGSRAKLGGGVAFELTPSWPTGMEWATTGARTTIHPGDQGMRELDRVGMGLPRELAADLVIAAAPKFVDYSKYVVRHHKDKPAIFSSNEVAISMPSSGGGASEPNPDEKASKPGPEASLPNPDVEASNPSSGDEPSKPGPDDDAAKPSPGLQALMPKYAETYLSGLKAWIGGAETPNLKAARAIEQLEALVDKS